MREAQEVKSSRPSGLRVRPIRYRVSAKRDQAGFLRMQFPLKLRQPFPQVVQEATSVRLPLEADDRVVRGADHDHIPVGMAVCPLICPPRKHDKQVYLPSPRVG